MGRHSSVKDPGYRAFLYEDDLDIAESMKIVVTTPATGSYWLAVDTVSHTTALETLIEDVTISAAGTALTFFCQNRQGDHPDNCACLIEHGGTYTGGTTLLQSVELRGQGDRRTLLKQSTSYQITVTSKADDNWVSVLVAVWQGQNGDHA